MLAAADVVVNPRRSGEAFGRVACEALVAGRPVVAMREGAVPEVLRDGETALLVAPGDSAALAGAAVRLLDDPTSRERLVAEGRRDVLRRFAPERSLAEFSRVVEEVAGARLGRTRRAERRVERRAVAARVAAERALRGDPQPQVEALREPRAALAARRRRRGGRPRAA